MNRKVCFALLATLSSAAFGCPSARPAGAELSSSSHAASSSSDAGAEFVYCDAGNFANCTTAKCEAKDGGGYSCNCFLDTRYSITTAASACIPASGSTLQSRYYPVESYQVCDDPGKDTPSWAWCLGFLCTSTSKGVFCDCKAPPAPRFPYIVVTTTFNQGACTIGTTGKVWSSATVDDSKQITTFLQGKPGLENLAGPVVLKRK